MRCAIKWIDLSTGKSTPDNNEAIALAQCLEPRIPSRDPSKRMWDIDPDKTPSDWYPICDDHIRIMNDRKMIFWSLIPLPGVSLKDAHYLIQKCPPPSVIRSIVQNYTTHCQSILKQLDYNHIGDYWSFELNGMYFGCERDGYIHT